MKKKSYFKFAQIVCDCTSSHQYYKWVGWLMRHASSLPWAALVKQGRQFSQEIPISIESDPKQS